MRTIFSFLSFLFFLPAVSLANIPDATVAIKMRDGTELPADIYLPSGAKEKPPAILIRSPSGKKTPYATMFCYLKDHGYSVVIQDTRSIVDHEGKTLPYSTDGSGEFSDGYDTIQWLKNSPYCNGSIGTLGTSSMGITQLLLAPTAPEGLKCQYIYFAVPDLFNHSLYHSGKFLEQQVKLWLKLYAKDPSTLNRILSQSEYNAFWDTFNAGSLTHKVNVPAIHFGGWYDVFLQGTLDAFVARQTQGGEGARGQQKLIIGPWIHLWPFVNRFGDFSYPKEAFTPPYAFKPEDWFAYYLKNESNHVPDLPPVIYFVMGPFDGTSSSGNRWKTSDQWPPSSVVFTPFYLTENHKLSAIHNTQEEKKFNYHYSPDHPVPTLGGRNLFLTSGPVDQSPLEEREDMILFTTDPLEEDLEITGPITAKIYFSTDQADGDLSVRLSDVYPDGKSVLIADGITNLSHFFKKQNFKDPIAHTAKEIEVDLWSTSMVFAKGHAIRLAITSSNFPKYEKSPHKSQNWIHLAKDFPSRLILPVIPSKQTLVDIK